MLYARTGTLTGIDWWIDKLQRDMYPYFNTVFGTTDATYNCYPRIFRNFDKTKNGWVPEWFKNDTGTNTSTDYDEVLWNDSLSAMSFFYVEEIKNKADYEDIYCIGLVFFCNLNQMKVSEDREDTIVREIVKSHVNRNYEFFATGMKINVDKTLADFSGAKNEYTQFDMQPNHCFRVSLEILVEQDTVNIINPINNF